MIENIPHGDVVPMPTYPLLATMKFVVEEPTTNCGAEPPSPFALTERRPQGDVVPRPVNPPFVIMKLEPVVEPTINWGAPLKRPFALIERSAVGVVVPMPTYPVDKIVIRVEVDVPLVVDAIVKRGVFGAVFVLFIIETREYGDVVPMPTYPALVTIKLAATDEEPITN